ncbi:MAG: cysteine peptidase family C39 domain-containing protein, partial [Planktothrix sp.]|uniref:cysteine peptidase family C39 domain-containing protein n=1 Tax=Planktothrix sp. TaxID=3088171 RepID=UPI0038D43106
MTLAFISKLLQKHQLRPVRTPTLLQMEAVECGAAALGIILSYYGCIIPLIELRRECGISRDGSKASNILKAARLYGLNAKGFKKTIEDLRNVPPPYIAFWNFNHFLVIEGFEKNHVDLNDPASGRRTVSLEEFRQAYTGIILIFEPGSEFKKLGKKQSISNALISRLISSKGAILYGLLAGLLLTIPRLAIP